MAELTEKNYAKFFGTNLLKDVLQLDTELTEEFRQKHDIRQTVESFDTKASLALDESLDLDADEIDALYEN